MDSCFRSRRNYLNRRARVGALKLPARTANHGPCGEVEQWARGNIGPASGLPRPVAGCGSDRPVGAHLFRRPRCSRGRIGCPTPHDGPAAVGLIVRTESSRSTRHDAVSYRFWRRVIQVRPRLVIASVLAAWVFRRGLKRPGFRFMVDLAILRLPVICGLLQEIVAAWFARTFATLIT